MKEKYKLITLNPNNTVYSKCSAEVAQRLAFSFGYFWWGAQDKQVKPVDQGRYLVFNVDEKSISYVSLSSEPKNSVSVWSADGLIDALTNPQVDQLIVRSKDGQVCAEIYEDSISFRNERVSRDAVVVPKELFDRISNAVNDNRKGLPVVWFTYPNSNGYGSKVRYVRVTRMDNEYIQGFEGPSVSTSEQGTFKKYSLGKVIGPVHLHQFLQKET